MKLIGVENHEEMSQHAFDLVKNKLSQSKTPVLGLATGSTPERLYQLLIEEYKQGHISFENATTFNLDEYVGLQADHENSYHHYMNSKLFKHVDIQADNAHIPNGAAADMKQECIDYDKQIEQANGIDLQILGLGLNGHIGFNEPGTPFSTDTHIVDLDASTRKANARFFDSIDQVPTQAITMGINTILKSKEIVLLISGEKKAEALNRLIKGEVSEDFPASILQKHNNVTVIADKAARSLVDRETMRAYR